MLLALGWAQCGAFAQTVPAIQTQSYQKQILFSLPYDYKPKFNSSSAVEIDAGRLLAECVVILSVSGLGLLLSSPEPK